MEESKIKYPCEWGYRVIGESKDSLNRAISDALSSFEYSTSFSNFSKTGKYISLEIAVNVNSEVTRNEVYGLLRAHSAVKVVI
ncbi:YbeD family protein [Candidatus Omnitrophota bacterium]